MRAGRAMYRGAACAATAVLMAMLSGCAGLTFGTSQPVTWFALNDLAADKQEKTAGKLIDRVLMIGPISADPFYNSTQLAYSRSNIARAYYQYAAWTQRPGKRLATLVERRLDTRGAFKAVASSTAGIRGDMLLNLSLDEIYHDAAISQEVARVKVRAELIDWRKRTLIGRHDFSTSASIGKPAAANAVLALSDALTQLLDELTDWVEAQSRKAAQAR